MIDLGKYSDKTWLSVDEICAWLNISRSSFYARRRREDKPIKLTRIGKKRGTTAGWVRLWILDSQD